LVAIRRIVSIIVMAASMGSAWTSTAAAPALAPAPAPDAAIVAATVTTVIPASDFEAFVAEVAESMLARFPEDVTDLGLAGVLDHGDDRLNDLSHAYRLETARLAADALEQMAGFDVGELSPDQRITLAVIRWYLDDIVAMAEYLEHEYAVNYITGAHANFPEFMADVHAIGNLVEAEAYVERLGRSADQMRQVAENLARSEQAGSRPTERGIGIAVWQISNQIIEASRHPLVADFEARLASLGLSEAEQVRLIEATRQAVASEMVPAYQHLLGVVDAVPTRSDSRPGALYQPEGQAYYAAALRHHTTTALTSDEVHRIGTEEVGRVRGELTDALNEAGFDVDSLGFARAIDGSMAVSGSVPLRSDDDREVLLEATEDFIADAENAFGDMFTTTPSSPIEVQRPRPGREGATGAYYRPPPALGERPGIYYLSLGGDSFETGTYATTNYHEAVPGHHFQIALQRESHDLPLIQQATTFTGYAEGWALYAERLAYEAGRYDDDPLGNVGRLRMELLRAARAVADTGIHALGWSRDQAIDYLVELGFPAPWASTEVDRYIVWPGQAPSYLIGMLEILRLRAQAQATLGADFDLAAFHDAVLRHGSVPIQVLEQVVSDYVDGMSAAG
jgi:uncharacterized protein (DUF885 family)